jgi:hypothetical protein
VRRPFAEILTGLLAAALLSCGIPGGGDPPFPSPSLGPGETVLRFTVVSQHGPYAEPPQVFAATTLPELKSLIAAANRPDCKSDAAILCWPDDNPPSGTLLIAVYVPTGCDEGRIAGASRASGAVLTIQVSVRNLRCPAGAGMQPAPVFSLVSVPLDRLPTGALTVRVHYLGTLTGGPLAHQPLDAQTTVQTG